MPFEVVNDQLGCIARQQIAIGRGRGGEIDLCNLNRVQSRPGRPPRVTGNWLLEGSHSPAYWQTASNWKKCRFRNLLFLKHFHRDKRLKSQIPRYVHQTTKARQLVLRPYSFRDGLWGRLSGGGGNRTRRSNLVTPKYPIGYGNCSRTWEYPGSGKMTPIGNRWQLSRKNWSS
jgi:hypothetical protein